MKSCRRTSRALSYGKVWRPVFKSLRVGAYGLIGKSARPFPGPSQNLRGLAMNIENLPGEQWLPIPGYESFYEVSNVGRVRSFTRQCWNGKVFRTQPGRLLKIHVDKHGYEHLILNAGAGTIRNHFVHRLVANVFVAHPDDQAAIEVNHLDGNKRNNRATNLEWATRKENAVYSYAAGLLRGHRGADHWNSIPVEAVRWDGIVLGVFANVRCATGALGDAVVRNTTAPCGHTKFVKPGRVYLRRAFQKAEA